MSQPTNFNVLYSSFVKVVQSLIKLIRLGSKTIALNNKITFSLSITGGLNISVYMRVNLMV